METKKKREVIEFKLPSRLNEHTCKRNWERGTDYEIKKLEETGKDTYLKKLKDNSGL